MSKKVKNNETMLEKGALKMKKTFKNILALILILTTVFSISSIADASEVYCCDWNLDEETGHLTVYGNVPYIAHFRDSEFFRLRNVIKSVSFADGVTAIEKNAFNHCINIERIELPRTLEFIGPFAFSDCKKLKSIELPGSLTYIGTKAFLGCALLEKIVIPPKVSVVSEDAFGNCISLEDIEIMNGETSLSDRVFSGCKNLKNVKLPENIQLASETFHYCGDIENVYYCGDKESFNNVMESDVTDYTYNFINIFYNQPPAVYPTGISIGSMPQKTEYEVGEELDLTGFELSVEISDGTTQTISDLSQLYIHGFYSAKDGKYSFTVEYYGYKAEVPYEVTVDPNGICGKYMWWVFDDDTGTLTISGYGQMNNYNAAAPWHSYKADIRTVKIEKGIESIGTKAFYECDAIEAIYYSGTIEEWSEIAGKRNVPREPDLYFNGELHEHSFSDEVTVREPTCLHSGLLKHLCECGDYNQEVMPSLAHTPGEWETDSAGRMVRICTECQRIVEVREEEPEEKPTEQPEQEETTQPEPVTTPESTTEATEEEANTFEQIAQVFEKIGDFFEDIFGFIAGLFKVKA